MHSSSVYSSPYEIWNRAGQKVDLLFAGPKLAHLGPVYTGPDKSLYGQKLARTLKNLRLHGTGGTGRIFERLSMQVWDPKKAGQLFDRHGSIFRTGSCKHPNRATFYSDGLESNVATGLNFARIRVNTTAT